MDEHGETSIPPYNFVAGGIIKITVIQGSCIVNKNQRRMMITLYEDLAIYYFSKRTSLWSKHHVELEL
jgi:hypothetical protein